MAQPAPSHLDPTGPRGLVGPVGVVHRARDLVAGLGEVLWAARTPEELIGAVHELEALRSTLAAVEATVLAEVTAQDIPKRCLAWGSAGDWFTHTAGTHHTEGRRTIRHAPLLVGERTATHAALAAGRISPEQAAVIVDAVEHLPHDTLLREKGEAFLLEQATHLDATALTKAARHLAHVIDPERADRDAEKALDREDRAAHLGRYLSISDDGAGGVRLRGRGTTEDAARIRAALLPLTKPAPTQPATDPDTCHDTTDPRDHGARLWDALVQACEHTLATDLPPDAHGARPRLTVTTSLATLQDRIDWTLLGAGESATDDGLQLPPAVVRRLACDADIIPVALGTQGEVLDVGRTRRLVTTALWRALVCRDQHCAFPGCTRPPVMGHAHHITHWAHGGPTSLDNLVLVCGHHHRTLHHTPWQVRLNPVDARPEFLPPPRPDRPATWIRHRPRNE